MIKNIGISLICIMLILSNVFVFTTLPTVSADPSENICPTAINPTIANQSKYIDIDVGWFNITVYDDDGNNTYGNITCSNGDTSSWSGQPNGTKSLELDTLDYYTNYTVWLNFMDDTCAVNKTYWFVTQGLPPSTSVNSISPYWQNAVPEVNIHATNNSATTDNVTLYYRYSLNNNSWGNWTKWDGVNNPDSCTPWAWTFDCSSGSGYYEFYSIGANNSSYEDAPGPADAHCHVNYSNWTRFGYEHVGCYANELYPDPILNHNYIQGSNFTCPSNGVADNMSVYIANYDYSTNVTCAIYVSDTGDIVGYSEVKNIGYEHGWFTFDIIGEPSLVAGTRYLLVVWGDDGYIRYDDDITNDFNGYALNYTGIFPDNIAGYEHIHDFVVSIYCRYTESEPNPNPLNNYPYPANNSINIPLTPATLNITVDDANGYLMNITFRTNESGVWQDADTNSSVGNGTYYCLNTSWIDSYSTKYWWSVNTSDDHDGWDNDTYCFTTGSIANNPPFTPSNPNPVNHATSIDINANLSWLGSDPDCGDIVTYDIYFGTASNPPLHKSGHTSTIYDPGTMNYNTKYYWKIIAKDNHAVNTTGPIWDFTTVYINQPPNTPYNPTPEDGKTSINIDQDLYWSGGDPDAGDTVTYDIYFGYILPLQKIASNISTPTYNPGTLTNSLTYFWKIVAWDNHGLSTNGPRWYFTTINATNNPPNKPNKPTGITSGKIGTTHSYTSSTTDSNGDYLYYWFDWGDGTNSGWDGPHNSGDNVTLAHSWTRIGTYPIKVKVKDIHGNESVWSDPFVISISKTKISNLILQLLYRIFEHFSLLEKIIQRFPIFEKILNIYSN